MSSEMPALLVGQRHETVCRAGASMDFIFMLTRDDRTVEDSLDLVELIRGVGLGAGKYLIAAGAVTSAERIRAVKSSGVGAFIIGTAVFNGSCAPTKGSILSQLRDVIAHCETA
jgi:hypothetical protein